MTVDYHIAVGFKGGAVSPLTFYSSSNDITDSNGNFNFFDPFNGANIFIKDSEVAFFTIKELSAAESAALDSGFKDQDRKFISRSHSPSED